MLFKLGTGTFKFFETQWVRRNFSFFNLLLSVLWLKLSDSCLFAGSKVMLQVLSVLPRIDTNILKQYSIHTKEKRKKGMVMSADF